MRPAELELKVQGLQDRYDGLSDAHARLQEMSALLEQRVLELERLLPEHLASKSPAPQAIGPPNDGEAAAVAMLAKATGDEPSEPPSEVAVAILAKPVGDCGGPSKDASTGSAEFRFAESIWDAAVFIGSPEMGVAGSVLVTLALLMNVCIQSIFVLIVMQNLVQEEFSQDDLDGLRAWRYKVGHDARYVSSRNGLSLAERVCKNDLTLEMATGQVNKLALIQAYLPEWNTGIRAYMQGWLLCLLAMMVWHMCIIKEVSRTMDLLGALWMLPTKSAARLHRTDEGLELQDVSLLRRASACLLMLVRLSVAGTLLWTGTLYLAYTTSMADLFLNSVALELVINIDELIFAAMAPITTAELVASLAPLRMRQWPRWKGADVKAVATPLLLLTLLLVSWFSGLKPTVDNLKLAREELCGGNTTFSFESDGLDMVHITSLGSFDQTSAYAVDSLASRAVKEARDNTPSPQWQYALYATNYGQSNQNMDQARLQKMMATVLDIYRSRGATCHDALDTSPPSQPVSDVMMNQGRAWPWYLAKHLGMSEPVRSCAQLRQYCFFSPTASHLGMSAIRALCPVTCGCNSLLNGSVVSTPEFGCPPTCLYEPSEEERARTPCSDTDPLSTDVRTLNMYSQLNELALANPSANLTDMFSMHGCGFVRRSIDADFCTPDKDTSYMLTSLSQGDPLQFQVVKVLTLYCPVECNCGGRRSSTAQRPVDWLCPPTCTCLWYMGRPIADTALEPSCALPNPNSTNLTLPEPASTDSRCCYLLQSVLSLFRAVLAVEQAGGDIGSALQGADIDFWDALTEHVCVPCRRPCHDLLVEVLDNMTATSAAGSAIRAICQGSSPLARTTTSGNVTR